MMQIVPRYSYPYLTFAKILWVGRFTKAGARTRDRTVHIRAHSRKSAVSTLVFRVFCGRFYSVVDVDFWRLIGYLFGFPDYNP